jgi:hypothetical protein
MKHPPCLRRHGSMQWWHHFGRSFGRLAVVAWAFSSLKRNAGSMAVYKTLETLGLSDNRCLVPHVNRHPQVERDLGRHLQHFVFSNMTWSHLRCLKSREVNVGTSSIKYEQRETIQLSCQLRAFLTLVRLWGCLLIGEGVLGLQDKNASNLRGTLSGLSRTSNFHMM